MALLSRQGNETSERRNNNNRPYDVLVLEKILSNVSNKKINIRTQAVPGNRIYSIYESHNLVAKYSEADAKIEYFDDAIVKKLQKLQDMRDVSDYKTKLKG